ncbi:MAG: aminotransferase class I/II-fold pyridoxal phosphate-dependent enzyme, partial [Lachnospiraceae bacterium]|nr:aminotransferase class I/II-fold pyridoxal phosphate-dependent enzyme [Lachnospiraceae bacterium]
MKKIYLSSPTMHGEEQQFVKEAFESNWVAPLGPNVTAFEQEMCDYTGCGHAAALSAGTAALHMAMKCLDVGPGDVVFSSDLTFSATCNPVTYEGGKLVFIDSEYDTWNMDPEALKRAYEKYPNPKAIVMAHLYGTPSKIDELMAIAREHGTPVIEDAAEALGSTYKGRQCGTFGDIGIYSFNGNKIITSSGGGMMVSKNEEYTKLAIFLSTQARDQARYYQHSHIGYNYRMSNIVAGVGRGQLIHLEEHKALKKKIWATYSDAFKDVSAIKMNPLNVDGDANCWLSCMTIEDGCDVKPDDVMDALAELNIETRPVWKPMHLQPVYAENEFFTAEGLQPNTAKTKGDNGEDWDKSAGGDIFRHGLCLPSDIKNTDEDMELIIK